MHQRPRPEVQISPRTCLASYTRHYNMYLSSLTLPRKFWDAYSGEALHSFPHNHIVRSVALSPSSEFLLTGGQEKKVRIFDLTRPDAAPDFLGGEANSICHDSTIKSVVWVSENYGVTAGEDGFVKYVSHLFVIY